MLWLKLNLINGWIIGAIKFHTDPEWGEKKEEENSDGTYNYFSTDLF